MFLKYNQVPPSPVIATTAPIDCNAWTIAILCFGAVLAKTETLLIISFNCCSDNDSISLPVRQLDFDDALTGIPNFLAIESAVWP